MPHETGRGDTACHAETRRTMAILALVGTTVLWGTSFGTVKRCGETLHSGASAGTSKAFGPLLVTALRFTVSLPLVWLLWPAARRWRPRRADLGPLLRVGLPMSVGFLTQAAGLAWTTATVSAFLTSLVVCLTPLAEWVFLRRGLGVRLSLAVALAVGGVALMTLTRGEYSFGWGEMLTIICAAAYALQIFWTNEAADRVGPGGLTIGSFAIQCAAAWVVVLVGWGREVPGALAAAGSSAPFWGMFAVIVGCATMGAMILMNAFQRYVRPAEAAVIYTSEPLFAAVFACILLGKGEALTGWALAGAAVLIIADLLAAMKRTPAGGQVRVE